MGRFALVALFSFSAFVFVGLVGAGFSVLGVGLRLVCVVASSLLLRSCLRCVCVRAASASALVSVVGGFLLVGPFRLGLVLLVGAVRLRAGLSAACSLVLAPGGGAFLTLIQQERGPGFAVCSGSHLFAFLDSLLQTCLVQLVFLFLAGGLVSDPRPHPSGL